MTSDAQWTGSMPEIYQSALGSALFEPYGPVLADAVSGSGPTRVLELAAGTGIATAQLLRALPQATVTATDLNPAMVAWGRQRVPEASWEVADAQQLPYDDGAFDAVACQFGVMFFPDRPAAFAEAARVLAVGGVFTFAAWDGVATNSFAGAMVASMRSVLGEDAPDFLERVPYGYHDHERIKADVIDGGLHLESIERTVLRGRAADARSVTRGFALGSPLQFSLAGLGDLDQLVQHISDEMTVRLGEGPLEGDLTAWLVRATRS